MCSSSPARTPKLQLTAEEPPTGECWIPPEKIPHIQGQRRSPNKMAGGAKSHLESNPIPARDDCKAQTRTQGPQMRDWARPTFECLCISCGGACQQWPIARKGALAAADLGSMPCEPHHRAPNRQSTNWRIIISKKFTHCFESSMVHNRFPMWGSGNGTENSQGTWLWRPGWFDYITSTVLEKQTLGGHKQNPGCTMTQDKEAVTTQESDSDFPVSVQESLVEAWVDSGCCGIRGTDYNSSGINPFEWCCHYPYKAWPQAKLQGGNTAPCQSTENWIKDLLNMTPPIRIRLRLPIASPSHQKASTSLLSLSIRGEIEWKSQLQKTNQIDHLDHSLL